MNSTNDRVVVHTETGFRTDIMADGHTMVADEPISVGGTDAGPTPYDYLVGALGACTAMTIRMYADRKEWPLESVTVRLNHQKVYAKDLVECETEDRKIDYIERELELVGPLDNTQRERLLTMANKCPVHRTLKSGVLVETHLAGRSG